MHAPGLTSYALCGVEYKGYVTLAEKQEAVTCGQCLPRLRRLENAHLLWREDNFTPADRKSPRNKDRNKGLMDGVIKRTGQER